MSDTIELLDAIGRDASLRHAQSEELTRRLIEAGASPALKNAAATGERSPLIEELAPRQNQQPQVVNAPCHEEEEEEEEQEEPGEVQGDGKVPAKPALPGQRLPHNQ